MKTYGFMALMATITISVVLISLTAVASVSGYNERRVVLDREFKRQGVGLAESCVNAALLKIGQQFSYTPMFPGEIVPVGEQSCTIVSVRYEPESATHEKKATIISRAAFQHTYTTLEVQATVTNPRFTVPLSSVVILFWREVGE